MPLGRLLAQVHLHFPGHMQRAGGVGGRETGGGTQATCLWRSLEAEWGAFNSSQDLGYQRALVV